MPTTRSRRPAPLAPAERRVLGHVRMLSNTVHGLAAGLGWNGGRLARALGVLCAKGVGRRAGLVSPERAGRPLQAITYVSLNSLDNAVTAKFEAWCREDRFVSQAVLLAGRCDYALWTWHGDQREAAAWRRILDCRPDVRRTETKFVRVLFGHTLDGAPVFFR